MDVFEWFCSLLSSLFLVSCLLLFYLYFSCIRNVKLTYLVCKKRNDLRSICLFFSSVVRKYSFAKRSPSCSALGFLFFFLGGGVVRYPSVQFVLPNCSISLLFDEQSTSFAKRDHALFLLWGFSFFGWRGCCQLAGDAICPA